MENLDNSFESIWNSLSLPKKKTRIERSLNILIIVGYKQIKILQAHEKTNIHKEVGYMYIIRTLESIWENIELILKFGKGKNRKFVHYPVRNVLENTFRFEYFLMQTTETQNDIAIKETLRFIKRNYDNDIKQGRDPQEFKESYQWFSSQGKGYPDIDKANPDQDPFPNMRDLTKNSKFEKGAEFYYFYKILCEATHGKLLGIVMKKYYESSEYVSSLMYIQYLVNSLLHLTDNYLNGATKDELQNGIMRAEEIVKSKYKTQ